MLPLRNCPVSPWFFNKSCLLRGLLFQQGPDDDSCCVQRQTIAFFCELWDVPFRQHDSAATEVNGLKYIPCLESDAEQNGWMGWLTSDTSATALEEQQGDAGWFGIAFGKPSYFSIDYADTAITHLSCLSLRCLSTFVRVARLVVPARTIRIHAECSSKHLHCVQAIGFRYE